MAVELITGHAGKDHIESIDAAFCNEGVFGDDAYVLSRRAPNMTMANATTVSIPACVICAHGRMVRLTGTTTVNVAAKTGTTKRVDAIYLRYTATGAGVESVVVASKTGTPVPGNASAPELDYPRRMDAGQSPADVMIGTVTFDGTSAGVPRWAISSAGPVTDHWHKPTDLISPVPILKGGTGASTADEARKALGVVSPSTRWTQASIELNKAGSPSSSSSACYVNDDLGLAYVGIDMSFESPGWSPGTSTWIFRMPAELRPSSAKRVDNLITILVDGETYDAHVTVSADGSCTPTWGWKATNIRCSKVIPLALLGL